MVFSQDNHSVPVAGSYEDFITSTPEPQAKLVRASLGAIFDVAVDIRQSSATFGHWVSAELTAENKAQLWIPEGFAHGFLTLSNVAEVQYKARGFWNKDCERAIRWDDPNLAIAWPINRLNGTSVSVSDKDAEAVSLQAAISAKDLFK